MANHTLEQNRPSIPRRVARLAEIIAVADDPARVEALISERVTDGVTALTPVPIADDARAALTDLAVTAAHHTT